MKRQSPVPDWQGLEPGSAIHRYYRMSVSHFISLCLSFLNFRLEIRVFYRLMRIYQVYTYSSVWCIETTFINITFFHF